MSMNSLTVCIVEDDLDVCESLAALVTASGLICHTFDSAEALLRCEIGSRCQCLIIDVDLPEMNGIQLLSTLRQQGCTTPAIFYSGRREGRIRAAAELLGNVPFIAKGGPPDEIRDRLHELLGVS